MIEDLIKIKRLENIKELDMLKEGNVVIISVGNGEIPEIREYHGPAIFIEESDGGLDFCRPQANLGNCMIGYNILKDSIKINERGIISSHDFRTYGYKHNKLLENSGLI